MAISGASASSWLQRHWESAVTLRLAWKQTSDVSWVVTHDALPPTALERLQLSLQESISPACMMFLTWLMVTGQTRLRALLAKGPTALVLPPLRTLRHLILKADAYEDAAIAALCQLRGLQTLKLATTDESSCDKTCILEKRPIECAQLALGSMASLTDVALVDICPAAIDLPSRCKLHVYGRLEDTDKKWCTDAAQAGHLATLHQITGAPVEAPVWLSCPVFTSCTSLFLVCRDNNYVLDINIAAPAFAALSALYIDTTYEMRIYIGASLQLRALHITAYTLGVTAEDVDALARSLEEFSFVYILLEGYGVVDVVTALQRVGRAVERVDTIVENDENYVALCTRRDLLYGRDDPWPCTCGACLRCLE